MPPTYSLVGDYFGAAGERTRAMATYWLAAPLSALISFMVGGWLNEGYGWRATFFIMGIPGLLLAVLVKLTIREPRHFHALRREKPQLPRFTAVLAALWGQPSSRHLSVAVILYYMLGLGLAPWYAAFMMRSYSMGTAELGTWLGLIWSLSGALGLVLGGYVATRWLANDERRQMRFNAWMIALLAPCYGFFLLAPNKQQALIALVPLAIVSNVFFGPTFALMQRLVKDDMRATTLAVVMLLANLIGMGVGPQIVGIASDLLRPSLGEDSLRYAMLGMSSLACWGGYHFWLVGRTVRTDLEALGRTSNASAGA